MKNRIFLLQLNLASAFELWVLDFDDALKKYGIGGDNLPRGALQLLDANRNGALDRGEIVKPKIPEFQFKYYDTNDDDVLQYEEFIPFIRERRIFDVARIKKEMENPPKGHLQPLGSHRDAETDFKIFDGRNPISPEDFWRDYIEQHRPAMFRGVDVHSKAYQQWNDKYLMYNYGDIALKVEPKIESRGNETAYKSMPAHRILLKDFIKSMKTHNQYAVSILPQKLAWDVTVPPALLCGSRLKLKNSEDEEVPHPYPHPFEYKWMTHFLEADFWLAHGRTRSQLHYDKEHNFNCLYRGTKKWILIDTRKHHKDIEWVRGGRYSSEDDLMNAGTDWVALDPDRVDMLVYSKLKNVTFHEFTQNAGDCVYLPYSYLHYVNKTDEGMQVAASYMWEPKTIFDAVFNQKLKKYMKKCQIVF